MAALVSRQEKFQFLQLRGRLLPGQDSRARNQTMNFEAEGEKRKNRRGRKGEGGGGAEPKARAWSKRGLRGLEA